MKNNLPFKIASLLCLPFLMLTLAYFLLVVESRVPGGQYLFYYGGGQAIMIAVYLLMCGLQIPPVEMVLGLASAFVVVAWMQKSKTKCKIAFISIYTVVLLTHIIYDVMWHLRGAEVFVNATRVMGMCKP